MATIPEQETAAAAGVSDLTDEDRRDGVKRFVAMYNAVKRLEPAPEPGPAPGPLPPEQQQEFTLVVGVKPTAEMRSRFEQVQETLRGLVKEAMNAPTPIPQHAPAAQLPAQEQSSSSGGGPPQKESSSAGGPAQKESSSGAGE